MHNFAAALCGACFIIPTGSRRVRLLHQTGSATCRAEARDVHAGANKIRRVPGATDETSGLREQLLQVVEAVFAPSLLEVIRISRKDELELVR
jgi:hypothetical protein